MTEKMYYVYHIFGKKIGVTTNIADRVQKQQGYSIDDYEIVAESDSIDFASALELELQKYFGYKVDRQSYRDLMNQNKIGKSMKINVTEQTTTFPYSLSDITEALYSNKGMKWETSHGKHKLDKQTIEWITENVSESMFNTSRCYVYNKALSIFKNKEVISNTSTTNNGVCGSDSDALMSYLSNYTKIDVPENGSSLETFDKIRDWADERGIYAKGDSKTQYVKLMEESGELARAILKNDKPELIDAIGDMVVVLTNLAHLNNVTIENCIDSAYNVISKRKGKMENGTFVKQTL